MDSDQNKQVVAVRLAGYELYALNQLADLVSANRTETVRAAIVKLMQDTMLEHPEWPMHPAWVKAGMPWSQANHERWIVTMFQHWAYCVTDDDPGRHLEQVAMDDVTAYRFREGRPTPKLGQWEEHIERYRARQAHNQE
ncbi:MAG: hypothetical protein ACE15C_21130 [Phycisphaerae bacterium]